MKTKLKSNAQLSSCHTKYSSSPNTIFGIMPIINSVNAIIPTILRMLKLIFIVLILLNITTTLKMKYCFVETFFKAICQNVSFPNGTQFDKGRAVIWTASFLAVTRSDNESLNLKF